jgi:hypothetical protein
MAKKPDSGDGTPVNNGRTGQPLPGRPLMEGMTGGYVEKGLQGSSGGLQDSGGGAEIMLPQGWSSNFPAPAPPAPPPAPPPATSGGDGGSGE